MASAKYVSCFSVLDKPYEFSTDPDKINIVILTLMILLKYHGNLNLFLGEMMKF